jgi:2-phosphosulfolactate phosphatase
LDVALVPDEAIGWEAKVVIMVDVIRASSTIVTLLEFGCRYIFPFSDSRTALAMADELGLLSIGEKNGEVVPGFHFNNSPLQLMSADVRGKDIILSTTNGTLALEKLAGANRNTVMIGSAINATACAGLSLATAFSAGRDLGIACAGRNSKFAMDDMVCAGLLAARIIAAARYGGIIIDQSDGATAALRLYHAYPSLMAAFIESESGQILKQLGQEGDLEPCSQIDASIVVPVVSRCPEVTGLRIEKSVLKRC